MKVVDRHLSQLPEAALRIFKCIWPGEPVPDNLSILSQRLLGAGKQMSQWRRSAARAGADTALRFMCSWYETLDLESLHSMRADAPIDTVPEKTAARHARAYRIASYASTSTFIPPPADFEEELTDDEAAEEGGEEEEETGDGEAEEIVADAPEEPAPEEPAVGNPEQAPEVPLAPEQAPESSSSLYL
jgi:hypothetical protein